MKRMEDKQLEETEEELNCILDCQGSADENNFYTAQSSFSSHETDTIVEIEKESKKITEHISNTGSKEERTFIESENQYASEDRDIIDVDCRNVVSGKLLDNKILNIDQVSCKANDITDLGNEEIKGSNEGQKEDYLFNSGTTNNVLLKKVSPLHSLNTNNSHNKDIERKSADIDYISETYRNIVRQINEISEGFKRGKKWKCNNPSHCHHHHNHQHYHQPHCRQYIAPRYFGSEEVVLEHGKDTLLLKAQKMRGLEDSIDVSHMSDSVFDGEESEGRERVLVRQMATEHSQDYQPEDIDYYDDDEDIAIVIEPETHQKTFR